MWRPLGVSVSLLLGILVACGAGSSEGEAQGSASPAALPQASPVVELEAHVLAEYLHDPAAFTQGLLWYDGSLYESTGQYGSSTLREVRLETGEVIRSRDLPAQLFGEGLARIGSRLVLLTWHAERAIAFSLESFEPNGEYPYTGEGWGLCFDGVNLIRSDGTSTLTFHDPRDFSPVRRVTVTLAGRPLGFLNELECVAGEVYANVWQTDWIVRLNPSNGRVLARVDASNLFPDRRGTAADVLNGIAYRSETGTFLLTGKNWPSLFEVSFVPKN